MASLQRPYFQSVKWSPSTAHAVLAGMKTVATLNGVRSLDHISHEMLIASRDCFFQVGIDINELAPLSPSDLARQVQDERQRQQALQLLILMPYLDAQVDEVEVQLVEAYAAAFNLAPQTLKGLRLVRDRKLKRLLLGYTWRSFSAILPGRGLWQKIKITLSALHQYLGDQHVAQQYQALSALPEGTLGRELFDYYRDRGFPLPGEKRSLSEFLVGHDLVHLLSGIGTDMEGEITVGGFEAGMSLSEFGFELLLEVILDFHLGLEFSTMGIVAPGQNHLNPSALMQAYARGLQMRFDLLDPAWDFTAVLDQPIAELRQRYGISEQPQFSVATAI